MKSRIKKLVTIALATTMLLGATLTVNAAGCIHNPQASTISSSATCGEHSNCKIISVFNCGKCIYCGAVFNVQFAYTKHSPER